MSDKNTENGMLLMSAPNGARRVKVDHPEIPLSIAEIADCALQVQQAGAAVLHLHVRDEDQKHVLDASRYKKAIAAIEEKVGDSLVIQITTEAVGQYQPDEQMAVVKAVVPEAASIALSELYPDESSESVFIEFWQWMKHVKCWPQIILYSEADVQRLLHLREKGVFGSDHLSLLLVLGRYGKQQATPAELLPLYSLLSDQQGLDWSVCAFGRLELVCIQMAACLGGHGRLGFENNLYLPDGQKIESNASLIRDAATGARLVGRPLITAQKLRIQIEERRLS